MNRETLRAKKKITAFLMSYPDVIPSSREKNSMVFRIKKELQASHRNISAIDLLFALLFVPAILILAMMQGFSPPPNLLPDLTLAQNKFGTCALLLIPLLGIITAPLLLTLLPVNKGGNS